MSTLQRTERGWSFGDILIRAVSNIEDIKQWGVHEYPDNPEYADYFLTTDDWRLRVKVCRVRYAPDNQNKWHLETHLNSDCTFFIMSGEGEALLGKDKWVPVRRGDLVYANASQPHGIRATQPDQEVWYVSVTGPGPVAIGDVNGKPHTMVGNGPPEGREH
jgi:mannose-6-phosphate isomerase-like protein (cupin superfamily)